MTLALLRQDFHDEDDIAVDTSSQILGIRAQHLEASFSFHRIEFLKILRNLLLEMVEIEETR